MSQPQYTDMKQGPPGTYSAQPPPYGQPHSQNAVIVSQPATVIMTAEPRPSNTGMIILSCCVLWCCCCPLGLAAFICAVQAGSVPDMREAQDKLSTAKKLSIAGLVVGIIVIILSTILQVVTASNTDTSADTYG